MFRAIGTFAYRFRFVVIPVVIVLMGGLGLYGLNLGDSLKQSGWYDPNSESSKGSEIADTAEGIGRDHRSDVLLLLTPPAGTTAGDQAYAAKVENLVNDMVAKNKDIVNRENPGIIDPFSSDGGGYDKVAQQLTRDRTFDVGDCKAGDSCELKHAFISIGVAGDDDTTVLKNYEKLKPFFDGAAARYDLGDTKLELAGLQPIANAMSEGMAADVSRAEVIALPLVALMLFFVFGGVVAAVLPVFIGGLTILGSLGLMKILAQFTDVNVFAQSVVTLIGLGIAIDYGLFIVSRFREELAEGYDTQAAVRRAVMTSGQTVVWSATIILAALSCVLIFPQGFLKSVAYGAFFSVLLAALLSITILPAILAILGTRIDALGFKFLRRTKTKEEILNGFWGKLSGWVMKHPLKTAVPTIVILLLLVIPFSSIKFGGLSEKYLPPNQTARVAQEHFDEYFPAERTDDVKLVIRYDPNDTSYSDKIESITAAANKLRDKHGQELFTRTFDQGGPTTLVSTNEDGPIVTVISAPLARSEDGGQAVDDLRKIDKQGLQVWVAGTPALDQDAIDSLIRGLPLMTVLLLAISGLLMFLAFGSIVLPIKAALVSALGLGATLGILSWIFVDGHGSGLANFTPGPLFAAVLVLIIAIIFGLSTDYEIFLLSRMAEARAQGASTTDAIRAGTAFTGRIITAAAAILVVVTGAFALSNIVLMKYIAFGMIAALILDATVIRMLVVPSVMKLLGDDCWWAPRWMQKVQKKIGLGEAVLDDERDPQRVAAGGGKISAGALIANADTRALPVQELAERAWPQRVDSGQVPAARASRRIPNESELAARRAEAIRRGDRRESATATAPSPRPPVDPQLQGPFRPDPEAERLAPRAGAPERPDGAAPRRGEPTGTRRPQPASSQSASSQPASSQVPPRPTPPAPGRTAPPAPNRTAPPANRTAPNRTAPPGREPLTPQGPRSVPAPPEIRGATAEPSESATSQPEATATRDPRNPTKPNTGSWRLGTGGISLSGGRAGRSTPAPATPPDAETSGTATTDAPRRRRRGRRAADDNSNQQLSVRDLLGRDDS